MGYFQEIIMRTYESVYQGERLTNIQQAFEIARGHDLLIRAHIEIM